MTTRGKTARDHVRTYRTRMKKRGLRQINLWVPDTRSAVFRQECRRQSRLVAAVEQAEPIDSLLTAAARSVEGWT